MGDVYRSVHINNTIPSGPSIQDYTAKPVMINRMNARTHILEAAEALFNERGYTAVGIDLIRDVAEVSKTTMYRQFHSKQGLIYAVLERRDQRFRESLQDAVARATTGKEKVGAILEWHFRWFEEKDFRGCMFMHALSEFKTSDEAISQMARNHKLWLKQLFWEQLPAPMEDREAEADLLMTLLEGLIVQAEFGSVFPSRRYLEDMINCRYDQISARALRTESPSTVETAIPSPKEEF